MSVLVIGIYSPELSFRMLSESEHGERLKHNIFVTITDTVTSVTFPSDCCTDFPINYSTLSFQKGLEKEELANT